MDQYKMYWKQLFYFCFLALFSHYLSAQFINEFHRSEFRMDSSASEGWTFYSGEGFAKIDFKPRDDYASIFVDATQDKRNVWWAIIRRCVSRDMDLSLLSKDEYELRIETRIKSSHAPRRVNLHLNTQRTTDFHSHLMEFDIPDTSAWHTISMTTKQFDARPGDSVYGQLALMDWGLDKYRVDVDYFRVDIVRTDTIGNDLGMPLPYHPQVPDTGIFNCHLAVKEDCMIDDDYPDLNFNHWKAGKTPVLSVGSSQLILLRWDFGQLKGMQVDGSGLLEITTYAAQRSSDFIKDFGLIRIVEILDGDPEWDQETVNFQSFCQGREIDQLLNPQMIIDAEVKETQNSRNLLTIPLPVLKRLIEGKTSGLAIRPLGAVYASFYSVENNCEQVIPKLHLNVKSNSIPESVP